MYGPKSLMKAVYNSALPAGHTSPVEVNVHPLHHRAAHLFSFTDQPVLRTMDLYRGEEER